MARKPQTWVVDLRHYLSEETEDLADMPGPVLNCAMFFTSIVAWVTSHSPASDPHTNVWCIRRPSRKRCVGEILAELRPDFVEIVWHCLWCGENGVIRGWEHTLWDRRPPPEPQGTRRHDSTTDSNA
jgi:hypothetical protein